MLLFKLQLEESEKWLINQIMSLAFVTNIKGGEKKVNPADYVFFLSLKQYAPDRLSNKVCVCSLQDMLNN